MEQVKLQIQGKKDVKPTGATEVRAMVNGVIECLVNAVASVELHNREKLANSIEFMMSLELAAPENALMVENGDID